MIGEWRLKVVRDELGALKIAVHHGLAVGRLGSHVTVALGLYWCGPSGWEAIADRRWQGLQPGLNEVTGRSCVAWHITLKAADIDGASGAFKAAYERGGVMSLHLHLAISQAKSSSTVFEEATALRLPCQSLPLSPREGAQLTPKCTAATVASPLSNDVRLFFPRAGPGGAEIWTNATLLERSSPYFKDMLKSGFCESVQIGAKRPRVSPPVAEDVTLSEATKDVDDSDDETDDLLFQTNLPTLYDTSELPSFSYRQVVVKETAYSTYLAVLRYLETGFIRFAPLRSGASDDQSGSSSEADQGGSDARDGASSTDSRVGLSSRAQVVTDAIEEHPDLPAPVSPKSTYRLAHLLKLTRLQRMCCEALRKQRTPPPRGARAL